MMLCVPLRTHSDYVSYAALPGYGYSVEHLVEALRYTPAGRGFDFSRS